MKRDSTNMPKPAFNYRLGLDMGTNSLGWAVIRENEAGNPIGVERLGSRIYSDGRNPKDASSLAQQRRVPRLLSRRRDRYLRRRDQLMNRLIALGLMPEEETARKKLQLLNPYELRAKGVMEALTPHEFGRVLFHLNQRRGFKSNRKTDAADNEAGRMKGAIAEFKKQLGDAATLGVALHERQTRGEPARAKKQTYLRPDKRDANKQIEDWGYALYVEREMVEKEFEALWQRQIALHPNHAVFNAANQTEIGNIIFFQRPLKPVEAGKCTFFPESETRAPWALPSAQRFRIYQELNHLRYFKTDEIPRVAYALSRPQRDALAAVLEQNEERSFTQLRKALWGDTADHFRFNLEVYSADGRETLKGNVSAARLGHKKAFGSVWGTLSASQQDEVALLITEETDEAKLLAALQTRFGLSPEATQKCEKTKLPDSHARLSVKAIGLILPYLQNGWDVERGCALTYDRAVKAAGIPDHRSTYAEAQLDQLPYYGEVLERYLQSADKAANADEKRYGKIANPTVHIGLRQLQKVVNAIIARYGKPRRIHLELGRELKMNAKQKDDARKKQTENRGKNEQYRAEITQLGAKISHDALERLKLFHQLPVLDKRCVYSGQRISLHDVLSARWEVDHILPFSQTFDDSLANKVLVLSHANRAKINQSPYQAFAEQGFADRGWDEILGDAYALLGDKKAARFAVKSAYEWKNQEGDADRWLARQLVDTQYLSRVAGEYLSVLFPPGEREGNAHMVLLPGQLTGLVRAKWGLNDEATGFKNRANHKHHAIDAAVVACISRGLLQEVSKRTARNWGNEKWDSLFSNFPRPWGEDAEGNDTGVFRKDVLAAAHKLVVSHRPDHGVEGALHEDTAYGIVGEPNNKDVYPVAVYKSVDAIKKYADLQNIAHPKHQQTAVQAMTGYETAKEAEFVTAFKAYCRNFKPHPITRLKIKGMISGVKVSGKTPGSKAKLYKGGGNYCYEIYCNEKGKWQGDLITRFTANQKTFRAFIGQPVRGPRDELQTQRSRRETFDGKPLIMRLVNNDMIAIEQDGLRRIMKVQKMSEAKIDLAEHFESNVAARNKDPEDTFTYLTCAPSALQKLRARRVFVDILGRVLDPGFKEV